MYWTSWGREPKLEQAAMDGSQRKTLITKEIRQPSGLALDQSTGKLFWGDCYHGTIESVNIDGSNRTTVVKGPHVFHPFGVAVHGEFVYWTDWSRGAVLRAAKNPPSSGNAPVELFASGFVRPMAIHVLSPHRQLRGGARMVVCHIMSYHVTPYCTVKPCQTLSQDVIPCHAVTPCHTMLHPTALSNHAEPDHEMSYHVTLSHHVIPCYTLLHCQTCQTLSQDVIPYHGVSWHSIPQHVTLCHTYHTMLLYVTPCHHILTAPGEGGLTDTSNTHKCILLFE